MRVPARGRAGVVLPLTLVLLLGAALLALTALDLAGAARRQADHQAFEARAAGAMVSLRGGAQVSESLAVGAQVVAEDSGVGSWSSTVTTRVADSAWTRLVVLRQWRAGRELERWWWELAAPCPGIGPADGWIPLCSGFPWVVLSP